MWLLKRWLHVYPLTLGPSFPFSSDEEGLKKEDAKTLMGRCWIEYEHKLTD